jgi:hypothetical protein
MGLSKDDALYFKTVLKRKGSEGLYRHLIGAGILKSISGNSSDFEMLNKSNFFFSLFRSTGEDAYFELGKVFRRAAHTLYRQLFKINKDKKKSDKFLNVVR